MFGTIKTGFAVLILVIASSICWAQAASVANEAADHLYQAQMWSEAAQAYAAIAKADPADARAWYRLGVSVQQQGKYLDAIQFYQRAIEHAKGKPIAAFATYNVAASYARAGEKDKALDWLDRLVSSNPNFAGQFPTDPDFASIQSETRFKELAAVVAKTQQPCLYEPGYRQFDFWLGEWDVYIAGQKVGTSNIKSLQSGCIIEENWAGGFGETGQSFNFYNPITKKWHESYMGNRGGNWMMDGEYTDGAMRYQGHMYTPKGDALVHTTLFNLGPDKVRHVSETSTDGGKTWTKVWDALYERRQPLPGSR